MVNKVQVKEKSDASKSHFLVLLEDESIFPGSQEYHTVPSVFFSTLVKWIHTVITCFLYKRFNIALFSSLVLKFFLLVSEFLNTMQGS